MSNKKECWDQKEEAEDAILQAGDRRWTILRPAFYIDNFIPPKGGHMFPELPQDTLVTSTQSHSVMGLICADDP